MEFLELLLRLFTPVAHAVTIERIGAEGPGVAEMWESIMAVFDPFTGWGAAGAELLFLKVTTFVLSLIGGVAICVLLYAGIKMIMSAGDESGLAEAKKIATYAVMGLVLAILADAIIIYIQSLLVAAVGS